MRWDDMQSRCVTTCNMAHNVLLGSDDGRTEREKMMAGDLYYSFAPKAADLEQDRAKCRIKVAVGPVKLLFLLCHNTIVVDTPTTWLSVISGVQCVPWAIRGRAEVTPGHACGPVRQHGHQRAGFHRAALQLRLRRCQPSCRGVCTSVVTMVSSTAL